MLKEGANLFGGKVELEDGSIAKWNTFSKVLVSKTMSSTKDYAETSGNIYIQYVLIDKLKRYFMYFIGTKPFDDVVVTLCLLYDYNTKELLDKIDLSNTYIVSNLSENMFVYVQNNVAHAVDFSTGKFVEKNTFSIGTAGKTEYTNYSSYFTTDIYIVYDYYSNTTGAILQYNIASNTFTTHYFPVSGTNVPALVVDDAGNCYIIASNSSNMFITTSKDNFTKYYSMAISSTLLSSFQYKNDYIYIIYKSSSSKYAICKFSTLTFSFTSFFSFTISTYNFGNILVNDDETAFYLNGIKYGTGEMVPDINEDIAYDIHNLYKNYVYTILGYDKTIKLTKYKNYIATSDYKIVVDPAYAYFGAPVTEIPEST